MRAHLTLVGSLLVAIASAQNWALLNPDYRYNYSNDGTDTISNQIRVMDIDTLGPDSFRYELNLIAKLCPCIGAPPSCGNNPGMAIGQPQVFGSSAEASGSQWTLFGEDTLLIPTDLASGASWIGPSGVQGTVYFVTEVDLFGQLDSVKWMGFTNGAAMAISKSHGIVWHSANGEQYDLIGVQGALNVGERFPSMLDFFDYQPGDILQYYGENDGTDGICFYSTQYTTKYEVLSRMDLAGRTDYTLHRLSGSYTWATPIIGWGGCGGGGSSSWDDIVTLGVEHEHWTADNFFGSSWMDQLWPQAFGAPGDENEFPGDFGSNYSGIRWRAYLDDSARYCMEPTQLVPNQPWSWPTVSACPDDSSYWSLYYDEIVSRYVEGVGRTYGYYFAFEHSGEEFLQGYLIGGVQYGTITPDDIILGVGNQLIGAGTGFSPNPASDHLLLTSAAPSTTCTIIDLNGRTVSQHSITSANDRINVQALPPGVYVLMLEGSRPQRFIIAR